MKTFRYQFTLLMKILIYVALAVCLFGFAYNVYQVCTVGLSDTTRVVYKVIQYALMFFVTIALFAILVGLLASSYYAITDKQLKTHFGFIVSKYEISKIEKIVLDRASGKLTVLFSETLFINIVIKKDSYDDFVSAILKVKPTIEYEILSKDSTDPTPKK
jgi:hypothetical protein